MKALSLFSGIGGIDLAGEWAGIETVAFCERDPFCQKVLKKHWPDVPIYDDVCTLTKERLEADGIRAIDLIHGGYPCQPFSTAGKRKGKADDRHLWPEVFRLIREIRPTWFVGENVKGHVSLGLDQVLDDLESEGYTVKAFVIPASAVGAWHKRERVFIVAHTEGERCNARWAESKGQQGELRLARGGASSRSKIVADTTGEGLPFGRRPEFTTSDTETGTGLGPEPQRRSKDVPDSYSAGCEKQHPSSLADQSRQCSWGTPSGWEQWATEPDVGRVANGIPKRVDRIKALGNAVVPQQIYPVLASIKKIDDLGRW